MGVLFDDTVVYAASASAKLVHGDNDPATDAVLYGVINGNGITESITATSITGTGGRVRQYYRYARDHYVDGQPTLLLYAEYGRTGMDGSPVPIIVPSYGETTGHKEMELYPIVTLKEDGAYINADDNLESEEYITTNRLLKKTGLNVNDLCDLIQDSPDEASVDEGFYMFALDVFTKVELSLGYLYEFFLTISTVSPVLQDAFEESLEDIEGSPDGPLRNTLEITEQQYQCKISWDYINATTEVGVLPEGAQYASSYEGLGEYDSYDADWGDGGSGTATYRVYTGSISFKSQTGPNRITSINIFGLVHEVGVDAFGEITEVQAYPLPEFEDLLPTDTKAGTSGVYIPLSPDILPKWKSLDRTVILNDAMLIVVHAADEIKLAWYELGIVKAIVVLVSFYAIGAGIGKFVAASAAGASAGAMSVGAIGVTMAKIIAMNYIVELIVKKVDGPLGILIATAAAIAIKGFSTGTTVSSIGSLPTASQLLTGANSLSFAVSKYNQTQLEDLAKQSNIYQADNEEALKQLQELRDELPNIDEDLRDMVVASTMHPDQYAEDFYNRVFSGTDSIVISYKVVENFVENALTLPNNFTT